MERWTGDRLMSFHGVTKTNDRPPVELNGAAQGDRFVVMSPFGEMDAPAGVSAADRATLEQAKQQLMME